MPEFPQGPFRLVRIIPARTETIIADWCKKDWMTMSPTYREIRGKCRNKLTSCQICRHQFADGEMMGLACFQAWGNRVVCAACADKLFANKVPE